MFPYTQLFYSSIPAEASTLDALVTQLVWSNAMSADSTVTVTETFKRGLSQTAGHVVPCSSDSKPTSQVTVWMIVGVSINQRCAGEAPRLPRVMPYPHTLPDVLHIDYAKFSALDHPVSLLTITRFPPHLHSGDVSAWLHVPQSIAAILLTGQFKLCVCLVASLTCPMCGQATS